MDQRRVLIQRKREKKKAKRQKRLTERKLNHEAFVPRQYIPPQPPATRSEEDEKQLATLKAWHKARTRRNRLAREMKANPNWISEGF